MNTKMFLEGLLWWGLAFSLYYFLLRGEKPSSKETNWVGMTGTHYVGMWGCVIIGVIIGFVTILKSL